MTAILILIVLPERIMHGQTVRSDVRMWMPEALSEFPHVRDLAISPDGEEHYFTVESVRREFAAIVMMKRQAGRWSVPLVAPFSGQYRDIEPAFSPDGLELYFASARPIERDDRKPKDYDIWYVRRMQKDQAWSPPRRLGASINTTKDEYYPSLTRHGDIYFTRESDNPRRKEDIFVSRRNGASLSEAEPLGDAINSERYEFNAFVAPDESFLMFTSFGRADDLGGGDLYISFRQNGKWSSAQHMGEHINSDRIDYCPFIDIPNGVLYFTSERSSMRQFFDTQLDLGALLQEFAKGSPGVGRIYRVPFPLPAVEN